MHETPSHRLVEIARRRTGREAAPGRVLRDVVAGRTADEIARRSGLPGAVAHGVAGFYDAADHAQVCDGTACHFGGGKRLTDPLGGQVGAVRCLGHCYAAPAFRSGARVFALPHELDLGSWLASWGESGEPHDDLHSIPRRSLVPEPVVLRNLVNGEARSGLSEYLLPDGPAVLAAVEAAGLRGRGGAAYPTAAKWRAARDAPAPERYVVANGDEGDPGSFVDRLLLEEDPHAVLAGMLACARAIVARRGIVYIRAEYPRAQAVVREAVRAARAAGVLGPAFDVEVVSGAGSYVCGEETALLNSIEGLRGEPRIRPPFPAVRGLFGRPTVVQNVETLAAVPWVARNRRAGHTKAVSLSGAVRWRGVVEVAIGTPLRRVLVEAGDGPAEGTSWSMALVGGPMGRVVPESHFDTPLSFDELPGMGHAGVVVLDASVSPRALAEHLFEFARAESCGSCAPCRLGSERLRTMRDRPGLERLLETMEMGSLCGFGQGVPRPIRDLLAHFGDRVLS
jgi:NADH:ubiquinone oxidoreductase subunit F (NADH-binding)